MPVKGKTTKSRTAKSTKKGPKLKWWYILPVIAIVAISGYAIVRFSQAAIERKVVIWKTFNNWGGGSKTTTKIDGTGRDVVAIDGNPVRIPYGNGAAGLPGWLGNFVDFRGKYVCIEAWVGNYNGNDAAWSVNYKANWKWNSKANVGKDDNTQTLANDTKIYYAKNRWDRRCIQIIQKTPFGATIDQVDITIWNGFPGNTKIQPTVFVYKVWYQDNL